MSFYSTDNFYPDSSMGYLARRVFQLSTFGLGDVFEPEGVSLTQWSALVAIHIGRGRTCAELADDIAHDRGATTRLIDTLVERQWVRRTRDDADRRVINLSLTDAGIALMHRCRAGVVDRWNTWLTDWNDDDAADLLRLLRKLRDTLDVATGPAA